MFKDQTSTKIDILLLFQTKFSIPNELHMKIMCSTIYLFEIQCQMFPNGRIPKIYIFKNYS